MALQVLTLTGSSTGGTESAIASIDIPGNGSITGVDWAADFALDADGEFQEISLSFASSEDLQVNDSRSVISIVASGLAELTTSGGYTGGVNKFVSFSPGIPVFAGERLYLHSRAAAGVSSTVYCMVHLETSEMVVGSMRAASRRR